jgi:hypothetical protein
MSSTEIPRSGFPLNFALALIALGAGGAAVIVVTLLAMSTL